MKEVQLKAPRISTISAHMTKLRKLGWGTIGCVFKGQHILHVCLKKGKNFIFAIEMHLLILEIKVLVSMVSTGWTSKQHLMRALAATCFSGEHHHPSGTWLEPAKQYPAQCLDPSHESKTASSRPYSSCDCRRIWWENTSSTRIHKGQASPNSEISGNQRTRCIASNDLPTPMVSSWKLPRPIHHLSMLLWQDLNHHHLDAKWNPNFLLQVLE